MRNLYFALVASLLMILGACNKSEKAQQPASAISYTTVDPATAVTIKGIIAFTGKAPAPAPIDMSQDPACQFAGGDSTKTSEQYVVNNGKLANVYVYIKEGLEGKDFEPLKSPAVLDQKGCRYVPHVIAMMMNQPLRILNDDPATHNVHPSPRVDGNREWNISQSPKGDPVEKTFTQPEVMMEVHCNQHPWMKAYLNVSRTPFFSVSDASGSFEIKGLPPGKYTIAATHEKSGEQSQKITVGPKDTKELTFTFSPPK